MAGQLIPPPELEPPPPVRATPQQRLAIVLDLSRSCEALFLAGLKSRIGPGESLESAFRRWYDEKNEYDLRQRLARAQVLAQREAADDC